MTTTAPTAKEIAAELIALERAGKTADMSIGPFSGFELIGALQLVLRHPDLAPDQRLRIRATADTMINAWFPVGPAHQLLQLGYDPNAVVHPDQPPAAPTPSPWPALPPDWRATFVPAGTTYDDEPDVQVAPGWWICGYDGDPDEGSTSEIRLGLLTNAGGHDITEPVARLLAGVLTHAAANPDAVFGAFVATERTCRACGCTDRNATRCVQRTGIPCSWAEPDLCTACLPAARTWSEIRLGLLTDADPAGGGRAGLDNATPAGGGPA